MSEFALHFDFDFDNHEGVANSWHAIGDVSKVTLGIGLSRM
jgi:hypothetical protein